MTEPAALDIVRFWVARVVFITGAFNVVLMFAEPLRGRKFFD